MLETLLEEAAKVADSRNGEVLRGVLRRLASPPTLRLAYPAKAYYEHWMPKSTREIKVRSSAPYPQSWVGFIDCMHCFYKVQFEDKRAELLALKTWMKDLPPGEIQLSDYWKERQELELSLGNSRHVMERDKCKCVGKEYERLRSIWGRPKPIIIRKPKGCLICRDFGNGC